MTQDRLQEIENRLALATPGPWEGDSMGLYVFSNSKPRMIASHALHWKGDIPEGATQIVNIRGWGELQYLGEEKAIAVQKANTQLIAHAPQDLLDMLNEIRRLQAIVVDKEEPCQSDTQKS